MNPAIIIQIEADFPLESKANIDEKTKGVIAENAISHFPQISTAWPACENALSASYSWMAVWFVEVGGLTSKVEDGSTDPLMLTRIRRPAMIVALI